MNSNQMAILFFFSKYNVPESVVSQAGESVTYSPWPSYKLLLAIFFIQLNHLTLLNCFPQLLYIIFNQVVYSQISYNVWKCLLLSFILFFSQFLCI